MVGYRGKDTEKGEVHSLGMADDVTRRVRLRSIPPASRRGRGRISSMRAATRTGFTFVGGAAKSHETSFVPHVVKPDPGVRKMRRDFQEALAGLEEKLTSLLQTAEEEAEVEFWQKALERLCGSGGNDLEEE